MPRLRTTALALALLAGAACGPTVGDECTSSYDCGTGRSCDLSVGGGYCTETPCRARGCEDEDAVCVLFFNGESYCMLECGGSGDCRDGHPCRPALDTDGCGGDEPCAPRRGAATGYCYPY